MNTHGILKLLDWMDCVRWFLQFLPSLLTPATFTVQGASTPCPYQGWQVSVDVPVHSPTPATPVETAYSPLHHQQPQVIRGLWTLNINHLFLRRNQSWGLVEWPWSFFANDFQETSNPNSLGIQSPREAGRLLRPNHIRMGLEWIAPLDIVRNHSLMVQNIRSGCEIEILHHQKHGRKPINNFW